MDLNFKNASAPYSTHGFHTYPAKMIPQIADALLNEYGKGVKNILDPFCGSGTSLVEANLHGFNAIGSDLNPLARLIAKVKTTDIEIQTLDLHLRDFYDYLFKYRFNIFDNKDSIVAPAFKNIDFWFGKKVKNDLSVIQNYIKNIENHHISDFFNVAFSQTIRECSWTRKNEFKLYKMSKDRIKTFKPDALSSFEKILGKNRNGLLEFMEKKRSHPTSTVSTFNPVHYIPKKVVPDNSIDLVLTSPPYGDSTTTVAYGQFSALSNQWLGFLDNGRALDKELMGGKRRKKFTTFSSEILNHEIREVEKTDKLRALDVVSFFSDYRASIKNVSQTIKHGGFACYVVSNRTVRGVRISTDIITQDFFEEFGFSFIESHERIISNKRMPKKNSSLGFKGKTSNLMNKEFVIVMKKT